MTHVPRKRFGQHFLCDQTIIRQIIASLAPEPHEHLIEIGPGQGALTLPILKQVQQLEVVELDRDLIPELEERTQRAGKLKIYAADALTFDFASIKTDERLLRIFGNLPYNISTPLIFHLLTFAPVVADMLFMLQKEVAERIAAVPSTSDYGRLSVMVQYHCEVDVLFDVPPHAFYPPPQVQSSIIRLIPYQAYPHRAANYALFEAIVKQAFSQRRKTLRNSLKNLVSDDVWARSQLSSHLRAENLSVADFVAISNAMEKV
ncbi:MAG: 16S rRNA (adenine(1518)-N(6)/adenine(1519)-N(6))-dimethyltransferase RsmA [Gammaproteobacteria bacterium]|nr:MAG: 16S rRNA (adenine(1518)-N(6)/adenine(1519)-N(6))-dimethyltransferase RsmA [Gammaproteobacteria bacterium]